MPVANPLSKALRTSLFNWRHFSSFMVLLYEIVAIFVFLAIPIVDFGWARRPFIGALLDQNLTLSRASSVGPEAWELRSLAGGLRLRLASLDGTPVHSSHQYFELLGQYQVGDFVTVGLLTPAGEQVEHQVRLQEFPLIDQLTYLYTPYFIGLVYLISSLWIFALRHKDPAGQAFAVLTASAAIPLATLLDSYSPLYLTSLAMMGIFLCGGAVFYLALIFPEQWPWVGRYPFLPWAGFATAIPLTGWGISALSNNLRPSAGGLVWLVASFYASTGLLLFLALLFIRRFTSTSPVAREQARLILSGGAVSFVPPALWLGAALLNPDLAFSPLILLPAAVFPLVTSYTLLHYRLLKTDELFSKVVLYGLLSLIVTVSYGLVLTGSALMLGSAFRVANHLIAGLVVFLLALLFQPLKASLQRLVDRAFARGQEAFQERMQVFSRDLTQAMELKEIVALLGRYTEETLHPEKIHIFLHDQLSDQYLAQPDETGRPTTDLRFAQNSPLVQVLSERRKSVFLDQADIVPFALQNEKTRLLLLGAQIFIPLPGRHQLAGWLGLGQRQSGEAYTESDLTFLESLCDQAALAIERAQVLINLERRMHEMNVLTLVSQGINVTIQFDDMLELIYAQTNQVIPALDFRITLSDSYSHYLYHVFYLENDERLSERENVPLPNGQGLEQIVVESHRPLITDDYERECRNRAVLPASQGFYAWAGVPLNTGAETIGVVSLGSRDPSTAYSQQQINLVQAIADQAAGAIVKARLLQESERRTRQLTSLNDVARSLTSTLELDRLLNQILTSAVDILNCEAGSLLLVDPETDELIFEVVVSPVASDLLGKRLPSGTGLVGKAVNTRQPIIANDVHHNKEWYDKQDQQTGFETRDLLVVPMQVKDRIIGVIEVINRLDRLPFTPDDQELLAAFTSQAAVAIENARLYTLTDQALASRVEELSVMQRIDRELNTSLDIGRAMRITLGWAMRQSGADSGLVGVVENSHLRVMASAGYGSELANYPDLLVPVDLPAIHSSITTGQVQVTPTNGESHKTSILEGAKSQVAVPIRREDETIGVLLLESKSHEEYPLEKVDFLSRLTDHAAIAIANAQLYGEVQTANLAKSKFVSFVAHELKNPMASIKGYTELVSGGMAGPVNEMQASFLATVSANLERMNTIVSDLNDLTKIEVGMLRLDFKAVQIRETIEDVIRSLTKQAEEKQHKVEATLPSQLPPVWADPARLSQVLTNLLSNAHKYTPQGGQLVVGVEVCLGEEAGPGEKALHVWVKDTGIGISEEEKSMIFQQYFRTDASKDIAPGTGLGLYITRTLVEMMGGRIWFDSELDEGTTFHFTVPVAETA